MKFLKGLKYKVTKRTKQVAVYILELSNGKHYCGITNCIEKRIKQHHAGKSKYTSKYLPLKLVWNCWCEDRTNARNIETMIKNRGVTRWLSKYGAIK